jgi:hypothetical protein
MHDGRYATYQITRQGPGVAAPAEPELLALAEKVRALCDACSKLFSVLYAHMSHQLRAKATCSCSIARTSASRRAHSVRLSLALYSLPYPCCGHWDFRFMSYQLMGADCNIIHPSIHISFLVCRRRAACPARMWARRCRRSQRRPPPFEPRSLGQPYNPGQAGKDPHCSGWVVHGSSAPRVCRQQWRRCVCVCVVGGAPGAPCYYSALVTHNYSHLSPARDSRLQQQATRGRGGNG